MSAIMEWLAAGLAAAVVGVILLAAVVIGAYDRLLSRPVGVGDVALWGGLLLYLVARHGKHILRRADGLDGAVDGRIGLPRH